MNEIPTRNEILTASSEKGLLAYLFDIASRYLSNRETEFLARVAELVGSGEETLFSERDWTFLNAMSGTGFFHGMHLVCELIPLLDVGHRDMMQLVTTLVRLGGKDLAANQPNVAFLNWCNRNPAKVQAVLDDARAGDELAIEHLCFALEAEGKSTNALSFLTTNLGPKAQMCAASALGRMTLDALSAATALRSISEMSIETNNVQVRNNGLLSSFSILEKQAELPRGDASRTLVIALADTSPESLDALSTLLWRHGAGLAEEEVWKILNALQSVNPEDLGTLEKIDHATRRLLAGGHFEALAGLIAKLISRSQGRLGLQSFPSFQHELLSGESRRLGKLAINWLLEGNPHTCSSLAKQLDVFTGQPHRFDLRPDDLPKKPQEQLFVCRKAVGFFFLKPVAAASVLVATLRYGDHRIYEDVLGLVDYPLLISYGGDLCRYLEEVVEHSSEPGIARIKELLTRNREALEDLEGIEALVELHPSEMHRHIEHVRWNQQMALANEEAEKQSSFHNLFPTQYLLYGSASSSYSESPDGETQLFKAEMGRISVSVEYPRLNTIDPEGLQMTLLRLKHEQRTAA